MYRCSRCGKKRTHARQIKQHIHLKHKGKGEVEQFTVQGTPQEDISFAERHIQATYDEAMGISNFDREWLI